MTVPAATVPDNDAVLLATVRDYPRWSACILDLVGRAIVKAMAGTETLPIRREVLAPAVASLHSRTTPSPVRRGVALAWRISGRAAHPGHSFFNTRRCGR